MNIKILFLNLSIILGLTYNGMTQETVNLWQIKDNEVIITLLNLKSKEIICVDSIDIDPIDKSFCLKGEKIYVNPYIKAKFEVPKGKDLDEFIKEKLIYPDPPSNLKEVSIVCIYITSKGEINEKGLMKVGSDYRYDINAISVIDSLNIISPAIINNKPINSLYVLPIKYY